MTTLVASKPIRTRSPLPTPKSVSNRSAIERWVRMWTRKKVNISDPDFSFGGPADNCKERESVRKFAAALQRELVHFEGWGTTRR